MPEPDVFEVVDRYLRGEITEIDLRHWLTGCLEWIDRWAPEHQRALGLTAQEFDFLLQDGEWTEDMFRAELGHEYRKAKKLGPSPVS